MDIQTREGGNIDYGAMEQVLLDSDEHIDKAGRKFPPDRAFDM
jgi:hypothetical protein